MVLVAITSQLSDEEGVVFLEQGDFLEGELPKKSMVKPTKIFTIHSDLIVKKICKLLPEKTSEVLERVRSFFS